MAIMTGRLVAFESRDYRRYYAGQVVSSLGTQMQLVALTWQLYLLTHSPLALGLLGACKALPVLVFALGGGVVADAVDRRKMMILTQATMALCSLALLVATWQDVMTPALIYGVTALSAIALAFDRPAAGAIVPKLVRREHLSNALSLSVMGWQVTAVAGPALGGVLVGAGWIPGVYALDVLSFGAYITLLALIRNPDLAPDGGGAVTLRAALEGLRFIRGHRLILATMVLDFLAMFLGGALLLMPIFADQILHVGAHGLGLLYSAQAVGAALAGAYLAVGPKLRRHGVVFLSMLAIYGTGIAVFGASRWLPLSLLALAISGAADAVSTVIRATLRQLLTPDEMRGRMTSVGMIFFIGGPQLGEVEAGVVAKFFGASLSVVSGGLACLLLPIGAALLVPEVLRYTETEALERAEALARPT